MAVEGGGVNKGDVQDLALPLGMSFAAVLAQVRWFHYSAPQRLNFYA